MPSGDAGRPSPAPLRRSSHLQGLRGGRGGDDAAAAAGGRSQEDPQEEARLLDEERADCARGQGEVPEQHQLSVSGTPALLQGAGLHIPRPRRGLGYQELRNRRIRPDRLGGDPDATGMATNLHAHQVGQARLREDMMAGRRPRRAP